MVGCFWVGVYSGGRWVGDGGWWWLWFAGLGLLWVGLAKGDCRFVLEIGIEPSLNS